MSHAIGENIKRLRRERKVTQEALASQLGLSCQAVSKWERGDSLPDISVIVPLANFFRVSTDEILGLDTARREFEIQNYLDDYAALDKENDVEAKYALLQKAYMAYPDDYRLIKLYIDYLCNDPEVEDGYLAHKPELTRLCTQVLNGCSIETIRRHSIDVMAQLYYLDGEDDKAIEMLEKLPTAFHTRNQMISLLFEAGSKERLAYGRRGLAETLENMLIQIRHIALEDTSFNRVEQLTYLKRAVAVIEQFIPADDLGFFHYHLSDFYFWMANRYVMTENPDAAIENIDKAFAHAKAYDELPETYTYTSALLSGCTSSRADRGATGYEKKVESQMTYLEETCARLYAPLMNKPALLKVLDQYR